MTWADAKVTQVVLDCASGEDDRSAFQVRLGAVDMASPYRTDRVGWVNASGPSFGHDGPWDRKPRQLPEPARRPSATCCCRHVPPVGRGVWTVVPVGPGADGE